MKFYTFNSISTAKQKGNSWSMKSLLTAYEWSIFDDSSNIKDSFVFKNDGTLIENLGGIASFFRWEYLAASNSLMISQSENQSIIFSVVASDKRLILLKANSDNCLILLNTSNYWSDKSIHLYDIKSYILNRFQINLMDGEEYKKWYITNQEVQRLKEEKQQKQSNNIAIILLMLVVGLIDLFFIVIYFITLCIEPQTLIKAGVFNNVLWISFVPLLSYILVRLNKRRKELK